MFVDSWGETLTECLKRTAFFAETHAIKGWLAISRVRRRMPSLGPALMDLDQWNQLLSAPRVTGLLSPLVDWDRESIADTRLQSMIRSAVFPMAYVAGVEYARRHGLRELIARDRELALRRIGNLGHSFTIHCCFVDVVEHLESDEQRELCAERYVEFVASQLAVLDATPRDEADLDGPEIDVSRVCDRVLEQPGFLGHSLITLGTAMRCRAELDAARWRYVLGRVAAMVGPAPLDGSGIEAGRPEGPPTEQTLTKALAELLARGSREVHTVTLADAAIDAWDGVPERRQEIERALWRFAGVQMERSAGGDRKSA